MLREALLALHDDRSPAGWRCSSKPADGGEPRAMTNLAVLMLEDGALDDALAWARRSVADAPMYANGQRILGKVALAASHPDEALVAYRRAYELEPRSLVNRFNLALARVALHRDAEARPHLMACLADPALADRARQLLRTLR